MRKPATPQKQIIPSIIAKTQGELDDAVNKVKKYVDIIQLDVMDGRFVPNTSLDFDFRMPDTKCVIEAHLMINDPKSWIEAHHEKADTILAHIEACEDPGKLIRLAKGFGKKLGFVLNPKTSVESIWRYLDEISEVLVMTVNPGFYGSPFLPGTLEKVKEIRELAPQINIEIDGGVTPDTITAANEAGANMFVSGSYIVKSQDSKHAISTLKKLLEEDPTWQR